MTMAKPLDPALQRRALVTAKRLEARQTAITSGTLLIALGLQDLAPGPRRGAEVRLMRLLRQAGYHRGRRRLNGALAWVYERKPPPAHPGQLPAKPEAVPSLPGPRGAPLWSDVSGWTRALVDATARGPEARADVARQWIQAAGGIEALAGLPDRLATHRLRQLAAELEALP